MRAACGLHAGRKLSAPQQKKPKFMRVAAGRNFCGSQRAATSAGRTPQPERRLFLCAGCAGVAGFLIDFSTPIKKLADLSKISVIFFDCRIDLDQGGVE